ncbi:MAG: RNA polymerase sigma factor [Xanthomonadales bacterium]|nr:ECF RNA polymerase sigma-E factor [Xanthomonadales bacterium]MCC6593991.1 RNA polymerase sigma factor [Xanthomonadales bacterium]
MSIPADEQAFIELLRVNHGTLQRLARHYAQPAEVRDLLQEMHLQLWRGFRGFEGRSGAATWVYRVALNTALSHRRRPRPQQQTLDGLPEAGDAGAAHGELQVLETFLAELDPLQRALLLLDLEGLDREQVAEVLGLSVNAVAIRMTRLRQLFEARFLEHV